MAAVAVVLASLASLSGGAEAGAQAPRAAALDGLIARSLARTHLVDLEGIFPLATIAQTGKGVVYLTFDDGPFPTYTAQVLDVLKEHDATATFFVIGRQAKAYPELVARAVAEGHSVQNHTWNHPNLTAVGQGRFNEEIGSTNTVIMEAGGPPPTCMRPPQGKVNASVRQWTEQAGMGLAMWDVDSEDWRQKGVDTVIARVMAAVKPDAIVLMHDGGGDRTQSVAALRILLPELRKAGYRFAPLSC